MIPSNFIAKKTGNLLMAALLLLAACNKQGPMGPEGPQGPDGPPGADGNGGGSATNIRTFISESGSNFSWKGIDGWGGYGVFVLENVAGLPADMADEMDQGAPTVYFISSEDDHWRLPFLTDYGKYEIFDCSFNGTNLSIGCKTKDNEPGYQAAKLKVVVAAPTEVHTLKLH